MASFTPVAALTEVPSPNQGFNTLGSLMSLDQKQMALQKSKELMPYEIAAGKAQASQAETQAARAGVEYQQHNANVARSVFGGFLTDPDFINGNSEAMVQKLESGSKFLKSIGVTPPDGGEAFKSMLETAKKDPKAAYQEIKNGVQQAGGAQNQYASLQPTQPTMIYGANAPGGANETAPQTTQNKPTSAEPFSQPEKLSYQVPVPGQPRAQLPSEEGDRQFGEKVRQSLTAMQQSYPSIRQNYDKLIDQTQKVAGDTIFGGAAGTAERALKAKIGTPEYQQLSKDLANAQIAQIKAEGGSLDTVAGQSLSAHANGSVTYDPSVLLDIARRNAANLENKNAQANGLKAFTEKYGDANAKHFLSMWNKNANDNSVFEMKYIFSHAKSEQEGAQQVAKYIKESGLSEAKRKELATKYLNLQKLETTGNL